MSKLQERAQLHNRFRGQAAHIEGSLRNILTAETLSGEARMTAEQMLTLTIKLRKELEVRVDR